MKYGLCSVYANHFTRVMKGLLLSSVIMIACSPSAIAAVIQQEKVLFGPVKYDVRERHGNENRYKDSFKASEGFYIIELRNGDRVHERSDLIEFTLNGQKLLQEDKYDYSFLVCVVSLRKENDFELILKDLRPGGLKRPQLPPRFVTMTVKSYAEKLPQGVYGANSLDQLKHTAGLLQSIHDPETASLALSSINFHLSASQRTDAMRKLSGRADISARPFILSVFNDMLVSSAIRGEAAIALGMLKDKDDIPALINGVLDPDEGVRLGSTRALSFFAEEDTREPLTNMLQKLDVMRMDAVIRAIVSSGWKPVGTLLKLAESTDYLTSRTAIRILGNTGDPRAVALLLQLLQQPGPRDIKTIIAAAGETKDARAVELLISMAGDSQKRAGNEAELGEALAAAGDMKAADLIADMIKKTDSQRTAIRLQAAYERLTGKEYK